MTYAINSLILIVVNVFLAGACLGIAAVTEDGTSAVVGAACLAVVTFNAACLWRRQNRYA